MIPLDSPLMMVAPQTRYAVSGNALEGTHSRAGFDDVWSQFADSEDQESQDPLPETSALHLEADDPEDVAKGDGVVDPTEGEVSDQHRLATSADGDSGPAQKTSQGGQTTILTVSAEGPAGTGPLGPSVMRADLQSVQPPPSAQSQMASVAAASGSVQSAVMPSEEAAYAMIGRGSVPGSNQGSAPSESEGAVPLKADTATSPVTLPMSKDGLGNPLGEGAGSPSTTLNAQFAGLATQGDGSDRRLTPHLGQLMRAAMSQANPSPMAAGAAHSHLKTAQLAPESGGSGVAPDTSQILATPSPRALQARRHEISQPTQAGLPNWATTPQLPASGPVPQIQPIEAMLPDLPMDADHILTAPTGTSHTNSTPSAVLAPAPPPQATVAQQITTAIIQASGRTTEIALNPEELGRVRISLTPAETGMTVTIFSERPETADLMRRNIELLAQEFTDLGYENLSFNFESPDDGVSDEGQQDAPNRAGFDAGTVPPEATPHLTLSVALTGGLDLKL